MTKTEIGFTSYEATTRLTAGKVCYQGRIVHNETLSAEATRKAFAAFAGLKPSMANFEIDKVRDFIVDQIGQGHRIDFGGFSVGLSFRGGLKSANAPFDKKENEIGVVMKPGKEILAAVDNLKPVNLGTEQPTKISSTVQTEPQIKGAGDVIDSEGERRILTCCIGKKLDLTAKGAGVWVEDDSGEKLGVGSDIDYDGSVCRYTLSEAIEPGLHWLVVSGRVESTHEFLRLQRRITVRKNAE